MSVFHLLYVSKAHSKMKLEELISIIETTQEQKSNKDLTGSLYLRDSYFLHLIEGSERKVREVFEKIKTDTFHFRLKIIGECESEERISEDWRVFATQPESPASKTEEILNLIDLSRRDEVLSDISAMKAAIKVFAKNCSLNNPAFAQ